MSWVLPLARVGSFVESLNSLVFVHYQDRAKFQVIIKRLLHLYESVHAS